MYSVLVVEDELTVCCGLNLFIEWETYGFQVAGFCNDGISAMNQLQLEHYDLVLCDIHIPGMDGLSLIHWMRNNRINAQVIIITAHAEFDYARRAIEDDVEAYLLKPINEVLLVEALKKVKDKLDRHPLYESSDGKRGDVVAEAVREIHNSYGKDLTAESLAKKLFISPAQLNVLFRKHFHISVKEYVNDVRMERAKYLLERSDKRVYEISKEVGFSDINYFTRIFRQNTGLTPSDYRKNRSDQYEK